MATEPKPIAQTSFELRANILKGQWEADELNDTDFFRAMRREYEDYIPALQSRITEMEKALNAEARYRANSCDCTVIDNLAGDFREKVCFPCRLAKIMGEDYKSLRKALAKEASAAPKEEK